MYPWQQSQWQKVTMAMQQQRLPHAMMLVGPKGVGKYQFARQLVNVLLCETEQGGRPCQHCRSCQLLAAGNHPDFINVELLASSKSIKIDQVRELIQQLGKTPQRSRYQVVIINPADTLNRASANALLKTLEEPPGQVIIMLLVEQVGRLPATIMSRCQRLDFTVKVDGQLIAWLAKQLSPEHDAAALLQLAGGAPLLALQHADNDVMTLRDQLLQHLIALKQQKIAPTVVASLYMKQDLSLLFNLFISVISDISRLQLGVQATFLQHKTCVADFTSMAQQISMSALQGFLQHLMRVWQFITSSLNPNMQLQLEKILIDWQQLGETHDR